MLMKKSLSILLLVGMLITSLTTVGLAFDASRSINGFHGKRVLEPAEPLLS